VGLSCRGRRDCLRRVHLEEEGRAGHWAAGSAQSLGRHPSSERRNLIGCAFAGLLKDHVSGRHAHSGPVDSTAPGRPDQLDRHGREHGGCSTREHPPGLTASGPDQSQARVVLLCHYCGSDSRSPPSLTIGPQHVSAGQTLVPCMTVNGHPPGDSSRPTGQPIRYTPSDDLRKRTPGRSRARRKAIRGRCPGRSAGPGIGRCRRSRPRPAGTRTSRCASPRRAPSPRRPRPFRGRRAGGTRRPTH